MIKVKHAAPGLLRDRRFLLLNAVLLLIYGWTLTESATIRLSVQPGLCTAHTPERRISISCYGLYRDFDGLYSSSDPIPDNLEGGPLDWLAPASAWADVSLRDGNGQILWRETFRGTLDAWRAERGLWRTRLGELRPPTGTGLLIYKQPLPQRSASFQIQAKLQRPYDNAGVLLLQPDGQHGWAFITTASEGLAQIWYNDPTQAPRGHSLARGLYNIQQNWQALDGARQASRPAVATLLILLIGGAVFSANRPWLDGPLVVARDPGPRARRRFLQQFPGRHAYLLTEDGLRPLGDP